MAAALAAAASASRSDPAPPAVRRLITRLNPIFSTRAGPAGDVAPAHATVVSTCEKLTMPGTDDLVTVVWASAITAVSASVIAMKPTVRGKLFFMSPTLKAIRQHFNLCIQA